MVVLEAGGAGKGKIAVKGGAGLLHAPTLPLMMPVTAQLRKSTTAICWEATYRTAIRNGAKGFKAKSE